MADCLVWILAVFGLTNGLATAGIFSPTWEKMKNSKNYAISQLGDMASCPKCLGFWVGAGFNLFYRPLTDNLFADMCVASATTWLLYTVTARLMHNVCRG